SELTDEEIRSILALPLPPADLADRLVAQANEVGGGDNIAAVVICCDLTPVSSTELASILEPDSQPRPSTDAPPRSASSPALILPGLEAEPDPEEGPAIRIVPESSPPSGLFRAIGDLLPPRRPRSPPALCEACGGEVMPEGNFCPRCGVRRSKG